MSLIRWEPFRDTDDFFREFSRPMFGRLPRLFGEAGEGREWAPAADISETDKEYVVKAELPGVKREDVRVSVEGGVLVIEGERKEEKEEKGEKTHRVERFYGSFRRTFGLPEDADAEHIRAESKEGVLKVLVPKLTVERPKATQIKVE
jgi:HSP20 family protein